MLNKNLNVLVLDDDAGDRKQIKRVLKQTGLITTCIEAESVKDALAACEICAFDFAIVDYRLPGQDGLAGITALHERLPHMAIVMATAQGDELVATEAMKRGALDYFPKSSIDAELVRRITQGAVEKASLLRQVAEQREELENFAHVLAHDLKTPIRSVALMAGLMEKNIQEEHFEEVAEMCRAVNDATHRMGDLIDTLRHYTHAEPPIIFERISMQDIVRYSLSNLAHLIQERGADITFDELPAVSGNAPQLIQLIQNLFGNSIKYCDGKTPVIHVGATVHDGCTWVFSVADNGIGIPENTTAGYLSPSSVPATSGSTKAPGWGLPLAGRLWSGITGLYGANRKRVKAPQFSLLCRQRVRTAEICRWPRS